MSRIRLSHADYAKLVGNSNNTNRKPYIPQGNNRKKLDAELQEKIENGQFTAGEKPHACVLLTPLPIIIKGKLTIWYGEPTQENQLADLSKNDACWLVKGYEIANPNQSLTLSGFNTVIDPNTPATYQKTFISWRAFYSEFWGLDSVAQLTKFFSKVIETADKVA